MADLILEYLYFRSLEEALNEINKNGTKMDDYYNILVVEVI